MSDIRIEHVPPKAQTDELSEFLCKEMLFEHLEGMLDKKRSAAVEKFLEDSEESQDEFRVLIQGVEFCEALSKTEVSKESIDKITERENSLSSSVVKKWGQWPVFARSFVQASLIASTTAFVVTLLPWEKLPVISGINSDKSIELVKVSPTVKSEETNLSTGNVADVKKKIDDIAAKPSGNTVVASAPKNNLKPKASSVAATSKKSKTIEEKAESKSVKKEQAAKTSSTAAAATTSSTTTTPSEKPVVAEKPKAATTHKGFVYRVFMDIPEDTIDSATSEIAAKIVELGGRKARSVELGRKMKGGRYFHLIIPEAGFEELQKFVVQFAPIRKMSRDSHKWVIKKGQVRSILWLEEVKKK